MGNPTVDVIVQIFAGFRRLVSGQPGAGRELGDPIDREVCHIQRRLLGLNRFRALAQDNGIDPELFINSPRRRTLLF
jgi:hypothetical protein